ncbi:MAG: hypothetical protein KKD90_05190 [Candidatus Omnitrophica bacterium]|nr:hypothetical protein [Candidatus Omnitrophota bacterium]MBU4149551.1 hypothetical protein [Candidatus Omnitrophota bacterium]
MPDEKKARLEEDKVPISAPLKVLEYRTISKGFGWWSAVVLIESWGNKRLCLYLWQKSENGWKRKQKYTIHSQERWRLISGSIEELIEELQ